MQLLVCRTPKHFVMKNGSLGQPCSTAYAHDKLYLLGDLLKLAADLLNSNIDLITKATNILASKVARTLDLTIQGLHAGVLSVTVTTKNIDRVDCYTDGRPTLTTAVDNGGNALNIPFEGVEVSHLELKAYDNGELVAGRKVLLVDQ